jgi:hypothetical protein
MFMKSTLCTWEDETCNRQVQFSIEYTNENGTVEIKNVAPRKVSFICPVSNSVTRTVGVHTARGMKMLASQFRKSSAFGKLVSAVDGHARNVHIPVSGLRMDVCQA